MIFKCSVMTIGGAEGGAGVWEGCGATKEDALVDAFPRFNELIPQSTFARAWNGIDTYVKQPQKDWVKT